MLKDKVVIITGAANGIGKEAVKGFAGQGAKVALVDLNLAALEKVAQEFNLQKDNCLLLAADVSKEEQVKQYVQKTKDTFGKIDIFFNNAGVEGAISLITDYPADALDSIINVNIKGVFYGLKYVLQVMAEQKSGSIINTSSVGGLKGMPTTSAYVASKYAIIGLTKTAALEFAESGVRVNAICPAMINTRMMRSIETGMSSDDPNTAKDQFTSMIPLGRYGEPNDIVQAVLFLASENASFITGAVLAVDGGFTA
ncbi:MAG: glucose 1-dehydrogenase [Desulfitobacteriaceae bacterium]|nr:glucose 1-dehydrogenase [Desulfitobacteriaceae bacterium]MDD4347292.1 glucose 1-dehydrogenase [Desulfitobacteriaceae bacterium]MDD4401828.1 glucose 1-dehydrogenase [Desulfitobacteriaceae bacterium]